MCGADQMCGAGQSVGCELDSMISATLLKPQDGRSAEEVEPVSIPWANEA